MGGSCTRLMHAHAREQAPTFTAVNLSPFILYEAIRCFTRNGVRFESLSMCRFPRSLAAGSRLIPLASSSFFEEEQRAGNIGYFSWKRRD